MKRFISICVFIFIAFKMNAQTPSTQIKIKEKALFRGERVVTIELSNQNRLQPLTSVNVNSGPYYYFLVKPAGNWTLDADIVNENLTKVEIYQNERKIPLAWKGELIISGESTSILIGFPKMVKLNQLFLFQCPVGDATSQAEFQIPQEFWPGYSTITELLKQGDALAASSQFKTAIEVYEQILTNNNLQIFPHYDEAKIKRINCFSSLYNETQSSFQKISLDDQLELKSRITQIEAIRPTIKYIIDSLPRAEWGIGSLDPIVLPILEKSRNTFLTLIGVRDSLQHLLDDQNIRWILEGSATSKNGYLYIFMIETLSSAFSSLDFSDTTTKELKVKISEDLSSRLVKNNILESYETFIRICNERHQTNLPIFPIEFLPNLKKDTITFSLPYYSMLKAVNDYYYGNYSSAMEEIFRIYRTSYETEINHRYGTMRTMIINRTQQNSPDITKLLDEALQLEKSKDMQGASEKYRQITLIAPNYAFGYFAMGRFHARNNDPFRAIFSYQRAFQVDSLYLSAYRECTNIYIKQGNYKEIINILTTAIAKGNDYWETNYNLGIAYLGDADPARAIISFERALTLSSKSYKTNIQLGLAYQSVKNYQKAREYFNNAIGIDATRQEAVDYLTKLNELQRSGK